MRVAFVSSNGHFGTAFNWESLADRGPWRRHITGRSTTTAPTTVPTTRYKRSAESERALINDWYERYGHLFDNVYERTEAVAAAIDSGSDVRLAIACMALDESVKDFQKAPAFPVAVVNSLWQKSFFWLAKGAALCIKGDHISAGEAALEGGRYMNEAAAYLRPIR